MKLLVGLVVIAGLVGGLLYMQGFFDTTKIGPKSPVKAAEQAEDLPTVTVLSKTVPVYSEAVGTVRSRRTTRVSPRLMGTILDVKVRQGDPVEPKQLLAVLDDREVKARVAVAEARLDQANAAYTRAAADFRRTSELLEKNATTKERYESSKADFDGTKAAVDAATASLNEARLYVGYTEIRAQSAGVVAEKLAEPGDLALPGKPILTIQDPKDLRLEADVRESLVPHLSIGATVTVLFGEPLNESIATKIEERAPEADPLTRTFRVKAPLGKESRASAGNFGRLRFRTGERAVLLLPPAAVVRFGQLETVRVLEDGRVRVRHVKTGRILGDQVEVLSGLTEGEKVVVESGD